MDEDDGNISSNSGDGSDGFEMFTQPSQLTQSQTQESQAQSQSQSQPEQEAGDDGAADRSAKAGATGKGDGGPKRPKEQLEDVPLMIPQAVCRDAKASLLVHLRDEALNFAGE
ncbi:unnamed protein product, partial [Hapterophycus canaliculatus]